MEVTRSNFVRLLPTIEEQIKECDYVSIDTEMTGISLDRVFNYFDTQEERYTKIYDGALQYQIIQYGLSLFKQEDPKIGNRVKCNCYNFYVFNYKVPTGTHYTDRNFNMKSSAMEFLVNNQFDFNKLFREGINWMNMEEEKQFMDGIVRKREEQKSESRQFYQVPEDKQQIIADAMTAYNEFLQDDDRKTYEFEPHDGFTNALICQAVEKDQNSRRKNRKIKKKITLDDQGDPIADDQQTAMDSKDSVSNDDFEVVAKKHFDKGSRNRNVILLKVLPTEKAHKEKEMITECIGFSLIIDKIVKYRKPLIGHNMLLDLLHTINQFILPLPEHYERFREMVINLFPVVFDNKYIAPILFPELVGRNMSLSDLYEHLKQNCADVFANVFIENASFEAVESSKPSDDLSKLQMENVHPGQLHDAGFDSYITGMCFLAFKSRHEQNSSNKKPIWEDQNLRNRLHNSYSFDIPFLSPERDMQLQRKNVFYIKFNRDPENFWQFFKELGEISVAQMNDNDALIGVANEEMSKKVFDLYKTGEHYRITTYADYQRRKRDREKEKSKQLYRLQDTLGLDAIELTALNQNLISKLADRFVADVKTGTGKMIGQTSNGDKSKFVVDRSLVEGIKTKTKLINGPVGKIVPTKNVDRLVKNKRNNSQLPEEDVDGFKQIGKKFRHGQSLVFNSQLYKKIRKNSEPSEADQKPSTSTGIANCIQALTNEKPASGVDTKKSSQPESDGNIFATPEEWSMPTWVYIILVIIIALWLASFRS